jgi:hypothetical protein
LSKFSFLSVSIPTRAGQVCLLCFFIYSKKTISSFFHNKLKKSLKAPGLCGNLIIKYLFNHSYFKALSFTSGSLVRSKFHHESIQTTVFHLISSFTFSSQAIDNAPAGSSIIQASSIISSRYFQISHSSTSLTSSTSFLTISKVFFQGVFTATPSANTSTLSIETISHF